MTTTRRKCTKMPKWHSTQTRKKHQQQKFEKKKSVSREKNNVNERWVATLRVNDLVLVDEQNRRWQNAITATNPKHKQRKLLLFLFHLSRITNTMYNVVFCVTQNRIVNKRFQHEFPNGFMYLFACLRCHSPDICLMFVHAKQHFSREDAQSRIFDKHNYANPVDLKTPLTNADK